ncbi:MAG TPA: hypothetical protein VF578_12850, partial [Methylomirabilota bacterium]
VPPEQVIGSAGQTKYGYGKDGKPTLIKLPKVLLIDDKEGKPEAINLIGTFPDTLMAEAKQRGWIVVSMKSDWKRIFAFE